MWNPRVVYKPRRITDKDGDGVEDNVHLTHKELERFTNPKVFGPVNDIHNTHGGWYPGHRRLEEEPSEPKYHDAYTEKDFEGFKPWI